ncbi:MAG: hypothetical protein JW913_15415, partial [Chitinispirillaceae bacterium]|nr:hypothetical protein [Chitinispirillaceae bacterium]
NPKHTLVKIYKTNRYPCLFKPFNRVKVSEAAQQAWNEYHADILPQEDTAEKDRGNLPPD